MSNPSPTFAVKNLTLKQKMLMGSTKDHLKLIVNTPDGTKDCVWWSREIFLLLRVINLMLRLLLN